MKRSLTTKFVVFLGLTPMTAMSETSDGAYGRIDGDAALQVDIGAGADGKKTATVTRITVRYLQTAGLYTTWLMHPGSDPTHRWSGSVGVELRPLFLPRFLKNMETGPPTLDLALDSLSLRMGPVMASRGPFAHGTPGFEFDIGAGIPIGGRVDGLWINTSLGFRWSNATMAGARSDPESGPESGADHTLLWSLTLGWQSVFHAGVVDVGDRARR